MRRTSHDPGILRSFAGDHPHFSDSHRDCAHYLSHRAPSPPRFLWGRRWRSRMRGPFLARRGLHDRRKPNLAISLSREAIACRAFSSLDRLPPELSPITLGGSMPTMKESAEVLNRVRDPKP